MWVLQPGDELLNLTLHANSIFCFSKCLNCSATMKCYYSDLEPVVSGCSYAPFHRGIQVSTDRRFGDLRFNIETFISFCLQRLQVLTRSFISLRNSDFSVASSTSRNCHARHYLTPRNVQYWKRESAQLYYSGLRLYARPWDHRLMCM